MNRSIQAEGSFANIKGDMNFRCYLCKGKKNVLAESMLLAMAHNINKLHHKIQKGTTGLDLKNGGTIDFQKMSKILFAWSKKWIDKN